ncbi:hypothetical protein BASA50_001105 [Batrachochytrium salamandrivorans]|uniref:Defective in cullin neddylation protein n=1 Tax=Batrachochytrium salamandrivorans TaxID=1357716 RepID=A0ABQ8ESP1_9FUNG|nr:hypothetical protein BASA62_003582 [Batrachochytrium salamandrivorans]KAH6573355.1 hypothetical protein BASA60_006078 [Batrachochytrium salamandrivorans]KAH6580887.1 hypothetical protein BASA61_009342 [Batrachochytrium salamandrivorans]KAH6585496.1 hypothetical protein BASA50_001105 [Batrachochytrium salamandrivorans]
MFGGNKAQKDKVKQFIIFTQASEKVATKFLKNNAWNLEVSVNDYFQAMGGQSPNTQSSSSAKASLVAALFDKYKDPEEDAILLEGTEALCRDLALDPADVVVLVLAFHLKCENMCEFTRSGWQNGWLALGCDNISSMKAAVETMRQELDDPQKAKAVYMFTFGFAKQSTQKGLALNLAFAFWDLLLRDKYEHLDLWKQFLEETHGKSITKDTWSLFWDFIEVINSDFSNHDADGAWPLLIDNFVIYAREKLGFNTNE